MENGALAAEMVAHPYVRLKGISKVYASSGGDFLALKDITLDVAEGEFVSIVGPSGCGKSTLLKCLAGLETTSSGEAWVRGVAIREPPEDIGFVFQRDVLLDWRTVIDNVLLPVEFKRLKGNKWRGRALELLASFDLEAFAERYPWELSGGMRQRVAICRGLLLDPPLLLMDEPFGALDAITRDELNLQLERLWERTGKTVIFITHSISEAAFLSSRVVVMDRNPGRIVDEVAIELPRPRMLSVRETPRFGAYVGRLRSTLEGLGIMNTGRGQS